MAGNNKNKRVLFKCSFCKSTISINLKCAQHNMKAKFLDEIDAKLIYYV